MGDDAKITNVRRDARSAGRQCSRGSHFRDPGSSRALPGSRYGVPKSNPLVIAIRRRQRAQYPADEQDDHEERKIKTADRGNNPPHGHQNRLDDARQIYAPASLQAWNPRDERVKQHREPKDSQHVADHDPRAARDSRHADYLRREHLRCFAGLLPATRPSQEAAPSGQRRLASTALGTPSRYGAGSTALPSSIT